MLIEKTCSRCAEVTWSNQGGAVKQRCVADGRFCDTKGSVYVDGVLNMGRLEF